MLTYTLLTDGSSDRALIPILTWLLEQQNFNEPIQPTWADFRPLRNPPRSLPDRIQQAATLYPCDLLFVHRDAEGEPRERRLNEINEAKQRLRADFPCPPIICVIPVRMQEAWLLFNEQAIRSASGNPNGRVQLELPLFRRLEDLPDPKEVLYGILRVSSGRTGRRLKQFDAGMAAARVAVFTDDFSPLRQLSAFVALENEINQWIRKQYRV